MDTKDVKRGNGQYINFGKYKGKRLLEIFNEDSCYLLWVKNNVSLNETTMDIMRKLLDHECYHNIQVCKPSMSDPFLTWTCTKCDKTIAHIEYSECQFCKKIKPREQLDTFKGFCYRCYSDMK